MIEKNRYLIDAQFIKGRLGKNSASGYDAEEFNHITIIESVDGKKRTVNINDPKIRFFVDKEDHENEKSRLYVPIKNVDQYEVPYRTLPEFLNDNFIQNRNISYNLKNYKTRRDTIMELMNYPIFHSTDVNIEDHFIGRYLDHYKEELIDTPILHKAYGDIEVDSFQTEGFPSPEKAEVPIDLMTIYSDKTNELWTYALRIDNNPLISKLENNLENFENEITDIFKLNNYKLIFYDDELKMIKAYFKRIHHIKPDFMSFWNLINFDFPYIKNRFEYLTNGKSVVRLICPPKGSIERPNEYFPFVNCTCYEDNRNREWSKKTSYLRATGWTNWNDQLVTYANLRAQLGNKDDYSLDAISQEELGIGKEEVVESMRLFSRTDYKKYILYNCTDVMRLHQIENKVKDIDLLYKLAITTRTRVQKAWRKTISLKNMASKFMLEQGYVCSNNKNLNCIRNEDKFEGAFVANPKLNNYEGILLLNKKSNMVFDNVADLDLASLYPLIILTFMIDPSNQIGRISFKNEKEKELAPYFLSDFCENILLCGKNWFNLPDSTTIIKYLINDNFPKLNESKISLNKFCENYFIHLIDLIDFSYKRLNNEELNKIKNLILNNFIDIDCYLINSYENTKEDYKLSKIVELIYKEKLIMTGSATLFKREDLGGKNITGGFINNILKERKNIKKLMFKEKEKGNKVTEERLDMRQKVYKVLANAFYGALGEKSFIFYDINSAPAVTQTGQQIIKTLIQNFEAFMGNNWKFSSEEDILLFLKYINESEFTGKFRLNKKYKIDEIYDFLKSKCKTDISSEIKTLIISKIKKLSAEKQIKIMYQNNLFKFLNEEENLDLISNILDYEIPSGNEEDINDENLKKLFNKFYRRVYDYVIHLHMYEDKNEFCNNIVRNTVLVCDTDSTFILVDKFVKLITENFQFDLEVDINRVSACNLGIYLLSRLSPIILEHLADIRNVEEEKKKNLFLKNEFLYKRLLLTEAKKRYSGLLIQREGKSIDPPEMDVKGLEIKTVKINPVTRNRFQNILKEKILEPKDIHLHKIINEFVKFENDIDKSILNGEVIFSLPKKFSGLNAYKFPYRNQVVRGCILWNDLFPDKFISGMENTNMYKIKAKTEEEFNDIINNKENEKYFQDKNFNKIKEKIIEICFRNENMKPYGFDIIAFPKKLNKIPEWLIPFIDRKNIINDNITKGIVLLESLGVICVNSSTLANPTKFFTNILPI